MYNNKKMSNGFKFKEDKKILIVADNLYSPLLFEYKNNNPYLDVKFMITNELKDILSFTYIKDPLPFIIKEEGIEYNKAKKYALLLKTAHYDKNSYLKKLYEKLLGEYIPLEKSKLDLFELSKYYIYLFEDDEDVELKELLNKNGFNYEDLHFDDLDIKENTFFKNPQIDVYTTKFEQFFSFFTKFREELIKDPSKKDQLFILCNYASDLYYINYLSRVFGIDVFTNMSTPLIYNPYIANKVTEIKEKRDFTFTEEELKIEDLSILKNIVDSYGLNTLSSFDYAYLNLIEIVNSKNITTPYSSKGLIFSSKCVFSTEYEIYVSSFQDDIFFKNHKDNNVLTDSELVEISANPSYLLTKLDKRLKANYIKYMNIKLLSRVEQHLTDKIYDSPFINEFKWGNYNKHQEIEFSPYFTKEAYELYKSHVFDIAFYNKQDDLTNSYDHSFKGLSSIKDLLADKKFSVSSIQTYTSCPFKYYLERIIPVVDDEKHQAWKGTLIHAVLEDIYLDNYDYEEAFEKGRKLYLKEMEKADYKRTKKEDIFLDIIHYWLYPIVLLLRKEKEEIKLVLPPYKDYEISIDYTIDNYPFYGSVDKIIFTDLNKSEEQPTYDNRFYTVIDYKTGSHYNSVFNPLLACTGYGIQLPLYYYGLNNGKTLFKADGSNFGGVGIRHIYGNTIKGAFYSSGWTDENILIESFTIKGLFTSKVEYYQSFADVELDKKGKIKKTKYVKPTYQFEEASAFNHPMTVKLDGKEISYTFEEMVEDTLNAVTKKVNDIYEGKFNIAPIDMNALDGQEKLTCSYCPYKDVCYHDRNDIHDIKEEIVKIFLMKKIGGKVDA